MVMLGPAVLKQKQEMIKTRVLWVQILGCGKKVIMLETFDGQ